jgi:hypothetical protein
MKYYGKRGKTSQGNQKKEEAENQKKNLIFLIKQLRLKWNGGKNRCVKELEFRTQ